MRQLKSINSMLFRFSTGGARLLIKGAYFFSIAASSVSNSSCVSILFDGEKFWRGTLSTGKTIAGKTGGRLGARPGTSPPFCLAIFLVGYFLKNIFVVLRLGNKCARQLKNYREVQQVFFAHVRFLIWPIQVANATSGGLVYLIG